MTTRTICVAAIQPKFQYGRVSDDLAYQEALINESAPRCGELALLSERFSEASRFDQWAQLAASSVGGTEGSWLFDLVRSTAGEDAV
jgi:hypothetical protein